MQATSASRATEIRRLHKEIWAGVRTTLDKAVRVEKLLAEQRALMEQDEWRSWVEENCPFAEHAASNKLRQILFSFTQEMGRTLIDIEAMNDELASRRQRK